MARNYWLRKMDGHGLRRSLFGARAHSEEGQVLLGIQTVRGIKLPQCLADGVRESENYSYVEGYFLHIDDMDRLVAEIDSRSHDGAVYELAIPRSAMASCFVEF